MQTLGKDHEFGKDSSNLLDQGNNRDLKPIDTSIRTQSKDYAALHLALENVKKGGWLSMEQGYVQLPNANSLVMPKLSQGQKHNLQLQNVHTIEEEDDGDFDEELNSRRSPNNYGSLKRHSVAGGGRDNDAKPI